MIESSQFWYFMENAISDISQKVIYYRV